MCLLLRPEGRCRVVVVVLCTILDFAWHIFEFGIFWCYLDTTYDQVTNYLEKMIFLKTLLWSPMKVTLRHF